MNVAHEARSASLQPEPPAAPSATLGSLVARFAARAIDYLLIIAAEILGLIITGSDIEPASRARVVVSFVIIAVAEATVLNRWARTPGKAALGLTVTGVDGGRLPWWRCLVRALIAWVPAFVLAVTVDPMPALIIVGVVIAGPAWLRPDRRALHDLVTGSVVHGRPPLPRADRLLRGGLVLLLAGGGAIVWAASQRAGTDRSLVDRQAPAAFGIEVRFSPPPHAPRADVYMQPFGSCDVTTADGTAVATTRASRVVVSPKSGLEWAYTFDVSVTNEYSVRCGAPGTIGSFVVVAEPQPSASRRLAAGGLGGLAVVAGTGLLVVRRRERGARGQKVRR